MDWRAIVRGVSSILVGSESEQQTQNSQPNPANQSNQNQSSPQFNHINYSPNYISQVSPTQLNPVMNAPPNVPMPPGPTMPPGSSGEGGPSGQTLPPGHGPPGQGPPGQTLPPGQGPSAQYGHPGYYGYHGPAGYPGHVGYPGGFPPYYGPGYPVYPGMPGQPPGMPGHMENPPAYNPATTPSAPAAPAAPVPTAPPPVPENVVEWVRSTIKTAKELTGRAIVGGYDRDGTDLWVIRTIFESELLPAKLNIGWGNAFVAYKDVEERVYVFEVCCADKRKIKWIEGENGDVPPNAIKGGRTSDGETLYIGRTIHGKSLCPGKIQPSHGCMYISYAYKSHKHYQYEVMCAA